jgi:hypothetical protein
LHDVAMARLRAQGLLGTGARRAEEVVANLVAVQAQEFAYARWSLAQRCGDDAGTIDRALDEGRILRTHALRPTWHFILPADIRWVMAATASRVQDFNALYYRKTGLDAATFAKANRRLEKWLSGGEHLTREEIGTRFKRDGLPSEGLALICVMMNAELGELVCSGASRGKKRTYALLDERAPSKGPVLATREARAELARRFFRGHGPATLRDFRWWSSLRAGEARQAAEEAGDSLEWRNVDGRTFFFPRDVTPSPIIAAAGAHLVQGYDEYIVAFTETKDVFTGRGFAGPRRSDGVQFTHAVLLGTDIVGHWRRSESKSHGVELYANRRLNRKEQAAVNRAIARYAAFDPPTRPRT